jgi:hypothetical protein
MPFFMNCYCDDLFQILKYTIVSLRKGKLREKKTKGAHLKADQVARTICTSQCGSKGSAHLSWALTSSL